jgi:uncharacterized membrane protein
VRHERVTRDDEMTESLSLRLVRRLEVFVDVVFALIFFHILLYLPPTTDMRWVGKPYGVLQVLIDNPIEFVRIFIGLGLTLIYWQQSATFLKYVERTDGVHASLQLLQLIFVCLFMYFAISDPRLVGGPSSPALQSAALAVGGVLGLAGWSYARKHGYVAEEVADDERDRVTRSGLFDPVTALLTVPLAFVGPLVWTLAWLLFPPLVRKVPERVWVRVVSWSGLWTLLKTLIRRV